jgi:hypothetical protein
MWPPTSLASTVMFVFVALALKSGLVKQLTPAVRTGTTWPWRLYMIHGRSTAATTCSLCSTNGHARQLLHGHNVRDHSKGSSCSSAL